MSEGQQVSNATFRGRHISLMRDVAALLDARDVSEPRILSFGCSNGSECLDLAHVMPHAAIFGCDINPKALAAARQSCEGVATILEGGSQALREAAPFDAVLALNVFCRHPKASGLDDVSAVYPFASFDEGLAIVDGYVKPGGIFALYNGQYFFEDAAVGRGYRPHLEGAYDHNGWIEKALPSGRRVTDVSFSFQGETFGRDRKEAWLKDPAVQRAVQSDPEGVTYRHAWLDPAQAEGRSTRHAIWIKQA